MFHPEDRGTGIFRRVQRQRVTTKKTGRLGLFNDTESWVTWNEPERKLSGTKEICFPGLSSNGS